MMHTLAAGAIVGSVKKRVAQGDCPTEKAFDVETLECALMEVHRLFEAEQRERETLATAVREECSAAGCEGPFDDVCMEFDAMQDQWCPWCRLGALVRKCDIGLDVL